MKNIVTKKMIFIVFLSIITLTLNAQIRGVQFSTNRDDRYDLVAPRNDRSLVLNSPGNYRLQNGVVADFISSGTVIRITSSDVSLDLQNFTLSQREDLSPDLRIVGIEIAPNLSNILIKNGKINKIGCQGIVIGENCFNIAIHNIHTTQTSNTAITINKNCSNIIFDNCLVAKNTTKNNTTTGIRIIESNNVTFSHCSIIDLQALVGYSAYGIFASNCNNCTLSSCIISGIKGKHALGIALNTCIDWLIIDNEVSSSVGTDGSATGLYLVKSIANKITKLESSNNRGTENGYGLQMKINSNYNRLKDCTLSNNYSTDAGNGYGALINKGNSNYIGNTNIFANSGGTDSASEGAGIKITQSKGCLVEKCKCEDNNGNAGTGYGIFLEDVTQCIIEENKLYYNHGSAGSYGIQEIGIPSSYVASNIAFGNAQNFGLQQETTLNSIQNIQFNAPRSVQLSHRGNVNITS